MSMHDPYHSSNPHNPTQSSGIGDHRGAAFNPANPVAGEEIKTLNSLLKGELAACDTYSQALTKVDDHAEWVQVLNNCRMSHEMRARKLSQRVLDLGGEPATSAGMWGAFAKAVEGGAKLLGDKAAVAALEEGEDKGLNDYKNALEKCTGATAQMLQFEMLPEQQKTHDAMSTLKKMMS